MTAKTHFVYRDAMVDQHVISVVGVGQIDESTMIKGIYEINEIHSPQCLHGWKCL